MKQATKSTTPRFQDLASDLANIFLGNALSRAVITLVTAFAFSMLFKQAVLAAPVQNTPAAPWYEIEVLIFSRIKPEAEQVEIWKRFLNVSFPARLAVLDTDVEPSEFNYHKVFPQNNDHTENSQAETTLIPLWPPYTDMGEKNARLNQTKKRLLRNGNFQILSHYHWVQPMVDRKETHPILVQAGKIYGNQYQLEGSIALSVSRYLHIDTDLWLSTFTENQTLLNTWWINDQTGQEVLQRRKEHQTQSQQCSTSVSTPNTVDHDPATNKGLTVDYITTQIAELRQSRRMRSGEIHYLDHPLFGVIVTANPYDPLSEK